MREVELEIPESVAQYLRRVIREAGGNEVFFLANVEWPEEGDVAAIREVEAFCRGDDSSVPAILEGAEDWDLAIHNHPSGGLEPSQADLSIAAELGNKSVGFAIIDDDASSCYLVVKPFRRPERKPVDLDHVRWLFGSEGPFAERLEGFESREGQMEMAVEVASALNDDRVIASEAGTGVGKSFAYLVPSILWALDNRERVVVSTGTINLQEQLYGKDLPFLRDVLPREFDFALMKGRRNYACKRKLSELERDRDLLQLEDDRALLEDLIAWSKSTKGGSLADLVWTPPPQVWERVMSETDKSLKVQCPFYDECFFYSARREANQAQVVVVNHHLFFADLAVRRQTGNYQFDMILPGYARVVFDEAHHLEDVASEHLGARFSRLGLAQRLGRMRSRDGKKGTLVAVEKKLRSCDDSVAADRIGNDFGEQLRDAASMIDDVFDEMEVFVEVERADGELRGVGGDPQGRLKLRYRGEDPIESFWHRVEEFLSRVRRQLESIARINDAVYDVISRSRVRDDVKKSLALEIESFANRLQSFIGALERFCDFGDDSQVRWLDTRDAGSDPSRSGIGFAVAPISVADDLASGLFERVKSIVMTSATLSVAGDTSFLGDRLGFQRLDADRFGFTHHSSPFDFERQVLLAVPTDVPDPTETAFEEALPELILRLLSASEGRAFVLFTSYGLLRKTYERLEPAIVARGWRPLAQGQSQRSELLKRFIDSGSGVLFGTDSFWEGVDVRGKALEQVIITRLPFRVPSEPLQEARLEEVARRGENPFSSYTVPQAVLRFKQGFGRLIRAQTDRGVVSVLDRRLLTKPYGRKFVESLPKTQWCAAGADSVIEAVESFFRADVPAGEPTG